jgi:predicted O-methyltransferase YrrM
MDHIKSEYESRTEERYVYLEDLKNLILKSNAALEGNCFYHHQSVNIFPELYTKQLNLFAIGQQAGPTICEIGFNAGHSTMLMLLGREKTPLKYTIFDIGQHPYTRPCYEYIKSKFPHVKFEYIEGDSTIIMPEWVILNPESIGQYDLVHVDGGHSEECISNDMKNADILVKSGGTIIIDDTNDPIINRYVDEYIANRNYTELILFPTYGYPHRIIKKN